MAQDAVRPDAPLLVEATQRVGLDFVHSNGMDGNLYLVEIMGAGGALFDYDGDGDLDLWALQGGDLHRPNELGDRLFRNDLEPALDGRSRLRLTDVTEGIGVTATGYGMGVAVGDVDNDGLPDLYLANFGPNQLLRNRGDGRFDDATSASGTGDDRWSVGATFLDYDRDGWLDLYVANYVTFSLGQHRPCYSPQGQLDYCGPTAYRPAPDRLYRNLGDGSFEDVSTAAGVVGQYGSGLAVVTLDVNEDGWPDLFVANDQMPNYLWLNEGGERFSDGALWAGLALSGEGRAEASMGIAVEDFDVDGDPDLVLTHIARQTHTYYRNEGSALFVDATIEAGLAAASVSMTGFGLVPLDLDNDGRLDLLAVNGAVLTVETQRSAGEALPLRQPDQLFRNLGSGAFEDVSAIAGPYFQHSEVGRGATVGDLDNDGDADAVVFNNNGPARLLLNRADEGANGWLGVRLERRKGAALGLGARVEVRTEPGGSRVRWSRPDGSYCSASDARVLFGLGPSREAEVGLRQVGSLAVQWSSVPSRAYLVVEAARAR